MSKQDYKELVEDKDGFVRNLLTVFDFEPKKEYTIEAVSQLEEIINEQYPEGHTPLPTTLIPFGVYLTKTLVELLPNASIKTDVDSLWEVQVEFIPKWSKGKSNAMTLWPFRRVDRFWKNREDSMVALIETTQLVAENHPDTFNDMADDEGWIRLPSGTMFRALVADTDEDGKPKSSGKVKLNANKLIKGI